MARIPSEDSAQAAREDPAGPSSSNKPFPQRYTVVEHLPSGGRSVSQSDTTAGLASYGNGSATARQTSDSDRFLKNSQHMEQRATTDFRDTLRWVSTMSGGPVDRRLLREAARSMKPNAYRDVMTERWVADICAYPPCEHKPRRPYNAEQPIYRINLRAKRVFDTSAAMKYCSDGCARSSIWYETVCLQQNAFEIPDLSQPIQLLEDTEAASQAQKSSSFRVSLPSDQMQQLEASASTTVADVADDLSSKKESDQYSSEHADNFLARLSIVERQPTGMPLPPSEDYADEVNQEDNPSLVYPGSNSGGIGSSSFNMDTLDRTLPIVQEDGSSTTVIVEERPGLARRIEIDVDPEYRDLMDESFELYKQMKEAGEFT